jgi:hypothetical protein
MSKILLAGQVRQVKSLEDFGISVTFHFQDTQTSAHQKSSMMDLMDARKHPVKVLIVPEENDIDDKYIEIIKKHKVADNLKTPSQRLRAAIHVLYEKQKAFDPDETPEMFYNRMITEYLSRVKSEIKDIETFGGCDNEFCVFKKSTNNDFDFEDIEI